MNELILRKMKISFNWLKEYVDVHISPHDLAKGLTTIGLPVDNITHKKPKFEGVIVAQIKDISPHPNADKLSLCRVEDGNQFYLVVCGAKNISVGDKVPFAKIEARLAKGEIIKKAKIRGIDSEGMLCSEKELGLGTDSQGIYILPKDTELGKDLALAFEDWVMDIDIFPNRPDCLGILGIAREVATLLGKELTFPYSPHCEGGVLEDEDNEISSRTKVEIWAPELCPRYAARLIEGIKVGHSPLWLRRGLESIELRPINNIVDITNYIMMEMGQPLHAFDFECLEGRQIVVRRAREGEGIITLDGISRTLDEEMLAICDSRKPVAIAGIMGGEESEVKSTTSQVLLESANFNPTSIRKTSKKLGLSSEASYRFERGIDPELAPQALDRAAKLMAELAGGRVVSGRIDVYPHPQPQLRIKLRASRANKILGTSYSMGDIGSILQKAHMRIEEKPTPTFPQAQTEEEEAHLVAIPPSYRMDLRREIDLIEEIGRLNGYSEISASLPEDKISSMENKNYLVKKKIRETMTALGYYEVINYSFISPKVLTRMNLSSPEPLALKNPLSKEQSVMRPSIIPGMLDTVKRNLNRQITSIKIFELGKVFSQKAEGHEEIDTLSAVALGERYPSSWFSSRTSADFFDLKGSLENVFECLRIEGLDFITPKEPLPYLHLRKAAYIQIEGQTLGILGSLNPEILERFEIEKEVFCFELRLPLLVKYALPRTQFKEIPKFPHVVRDFAIVVDEELPVRKIYDLVLSQPDSYIESVILFDVYTGKPVTPGKKSLAFSIKYVNRERTLSDEEVNSIHQRVVSKVIEETKGWLRGD